MQKLKSVDADLRLIKGDDGNVFFWLNPGGQIVVVNTSCWGEMIDVTLPESEEEAINLAYDLLDRSYELLDESDAFKSAVDVYKLRKGIT